MGKRKRRQRYSGPDLTSHLDISKGDVIELSLGDHADDGNPVGDHLGAPISVLGGLAGERVCAEVIWINPDVVYARVVDVIEPSSHRREAPCGYFLQCTGCQWQHVEYAHQLVLKRERVQGAMALHDGLSGYMIDPVVPSPAHYEYRNHARFTVARWPENRGQVGFVSGVTRRFVKIDRCLLMNGPVNKVLNGVQGKLDGMSQFSVRASASGGSVLIQPQLPPGIGPRSGQRHYDDRVRGKDFRVASPSFFQVNTAQLEQMVELVAGMLELDGSGTLLDAYSGVGTFAVLFAPYVNRVIAVEESASAVADARINASGIAGIEFIEGRSEEVMPELAGTVDYVILDPPRSGCLPEALDAARRLSPAKLVLVSCDTDSMARDQSRLLDHGFTLERVQPLDMFPQTRHVEVVSLFSGPVDSS